jgi:hypothetical protein
MPDFSSASEFTSVEAFLESARQAKATRLESVADHLAPVIDDPHAFSVPPDLLSPIEDLTERYGDEALKAIAMFCLGSWHNIHQDMLQQHIAHGNNESALWTMGDAAKLSLLMQGIMDLGSFSGDEQWKAMLKKATAQTVIEHFEENNIPLEGFGHD